MVVYDRDLTLPEQLLLVALRDEEGTIESKASAYGMALGGAILAELTLAGRISIADDKKALVDLVDESPLDDAVLNRSLELVAQAKRRGRAASWVSKFAQQKGLRHHIAQSLCEKGVLRSETGKVMGIFKRRLYPTVDHGPEQQLLGRLRDAIHGNSERVDSRLCVLVALLHQTKMLKVYFDSRELKQRKERLDRLASGQYIDGPREAVRAAQAAQAAVVAIIAATTASTAAAAAG